MPFPPDDSDRPLLGAAPSPFVSRVVAALQRHTELAAEIRDSVTGAAVGDRARWDLAIFGVIALASRVARHPIDVRQVVARFVAAALGTHADAAARTHRAESAAAMVDALCLLVGDELRLADDLTARCAAAGQVC
jgi:hypothetical protein